jgi:hypothetical protein
VIVITSYQCLLNAHTPPPIDSLPHWPSRRLTQQPVRPDSCSLKQEATVDENERELIREFQNFLINKGAKIEASGEFDVETFIASMKMYERLSK